MLRAARFAHLPKQGRNPRKGGDLVFASNGLISGYQIPAFAGIATFPAGRLGAFVLTLLAFFIAIASQSFADPAYMRPGEAKSGTLLFKAIEEDRYVQAPLVGTDIDITVSGPTARARVTQHFYNPTGGWVEGIYVYPLPDNSAVDTLRMVVGDKVIVGEIKERVEAKRIYEEAKAAGQKTALVEQERPNIFTNSVANIGPGEVVVVQLEYQQTVPQSGNAFALRVPLVVAPRYAPKPIVQTVDFQGNGGWGQAGDPVPDRERVSPPVLDPRENAPINPVTLTVRLQAGFPLGEVKSHHHAVKVEDMAEDARIVRLDGQVPADRDFELTWTAKSGATPNAGLFHERLGTTDYLLAYLTPPVAQQQAKPRPREIIFVIDNSGSMGGTSIVQAKAGLQYALRKLKPEDRFNIVRFDDTMELLFPAAVPGDLEHIGRAQSFVGALQANGGTEMVPAMQAALVDANASDTETVRQVVFLTDGAIANEQQLFETIASGLGRSRIFMVGIGSAPNTHLMGRAAEIGRGSVVHIGSTAQVEERMRALFNKLERPAVTDIKVTFSESGVDYAPRPIPDLYAGETLQVAAKLSAFRGTAEISGLIGDQIWRAKLPLSGAAEAKGISKLWARARINDAEIGLTTGKVSKTMADRQILDLALEHSLVSRLTSLVAVDRTPSRPEGARLSSAELPLNLPAGWEFDKVFGNGARDASQRADAGPDRTVETEDGYLVKIAAEHQPNNAKLTAKQTPISVSLPKTATPATLYLWLGLVLVALTIGLVTAVCYAEARGKA
jgi:Ca-activated chloride channel family protein